jgi:hypothetical protein
MTDIIDTQTTVLIVNSHGDMLVASRLKALLKKNNYPVVIVSELDNSDKSNYIILIEKVIHQSNMFPLSEKQFASMKPLEVFEDYSWRNGSRKKGGKFSYSRH